MRAVIVCVDYWDYLKITLPLNSDHFDEVVIITSPRDEKTIQTVEEIWDNHYTLLLTDLFYEEGAVFNKWKALEWGLDQVGRDGWLCLLDADIVLPPVHVWDFRKLDLVTGNLYTPRRRMNPGFDVPPHTEWAQRFQLHRNEQEFAGYCQVFHASDPTLPSPPPWHETNWKHAGGADSFFQARWKPENKIRPPFECLHLGEAGRNWCGRATRYADGTSPQEGEQRSKQLRNFIGSRQRGPHRFDNEKY